MIFEHWMAERKMVLLADKRNQLFEALPRAPDFREKRAELHHVLTRIEHQKRFVESPMTASSLLNIPMIA